MILSDTAVKHPVIAIVANLLLIIFGLIAMNRITLREYPDIDPPVVSIETTYTGASATTVERKITQPIEDRISGIEGIRFIESSSKDGLSSISIEFDINRNIDAAVNDVRDRIGRIIDDLPVEADAPEIFKVDSNDQVMMWLSLSSSSMDSLQLTDYVERYLKDQFSVVDGVARIYIGGAKRYAMRIWLNRKAMAGKQVTANEIEKALREANVELPAGRVESQQREFTVRVARNYKTPADFSNLVIRRGTDGHLVRLGEVARVEVGPENYRTEMHSNGRERISLGIIKQSRANALSVANAINKEVAKVQKVLPAGTKLTVSYDTSVFIKAAIFEVFKTLTIALALVILVIYLFLGSVRSVLIPAVTVPICLITTFIILYIFDFSLNLITLLAFVLAIGLVVDDAIVVLENIYRRIHTGEPPLLAALRGTRQVGFAVVATTLVLVAVFLPISFLQGNIGRLFTEFAVTIAGAVLISSFVALTLSPVMCAKLLKQNGGSHWFRDFIDKIIDRLSSAYKASLSKCIKYPKSVGLFFLIVIAIGIGLYQLIPQEFAPQEDRGVFFIIVQGPEGASFSYMQNNMRQMEKILMPLVEHGESSRILSILPRGFGSSDVINNGLGVVVMQPWNKRKYSTQQSVQRYAGQLMQIPGVQAFPVIRQGIGDRQIRQKVQFVIGGTNYQELAKWRDIILAEARKNPNLINVDADYKETKPQIIVNIDRDRAAELGVSIEAIGKTLETMFGSREVTTYIDNGEEYDIILEAQEKQKQSKKDLENIYVRSTRSNELIPLSNLVTVKETATAGTLNRFNRLRSITISASLAPGYKLGQALNFLENVVKEKLPIVAKVDYKGASREFKEASASVYFIFLLAILITFLILSAQFGSFIHPIIIMLTVPLAIAGALFGLFITNGTLNIYSEIGIIMLVGLAAKNGILIVEFINQLRERKIAFKQAIVDGSSIRFRPVIMTAISTIFGAIPLILATGAGANSRITIGVVIFFGVTFATLLTLYVIPVFYAVLAKRTKPRNYIARKLKSLEENIGFEQ